MDFIRDQRLLGTRPPIPPNSSSGRSSFSSSTTSASTSTSSSTDTPHTVAPPAALPRSRLAKNIIQEGDLVILYERHDALDQMVCKRGEVLQNRFGKFYHDDIIGKPFGTCIKSYYNEGYLYVLRPTPELWSGAAVRRTQIVNDLDAGFIVFHLDLHPGCVVVESGTGSGCMTVAIARTISPHGHVHTFEYNAVRADTAREEFAQLGMAHLVTVQCHDVCGKLNPALAGFPGVVSGSADAVFLDLPEPWYAVAQARRVLKGNGSVCCYSPCIEQCIKTFEALRREGFHSIRMFEVRQRPFDGRVIAFEKLDLGPVPHEEADSANGMGIEGGAGKGAIGADDAGAKAGAGEEGCSAGAAAPPSSPSAAAAATIEGSAAMAIAPVASEMDDNAFPKYVPVLLPPKSITVLRAINTMKGHTAFLTFAVKSLSTADGDFNEDTREHEGDEREAEPEGGLRRKGGREHEGDEREAEPEGGLGRKGGRTAT